MKHKLPLFALLCIMASFSYAQTSVSPAQQLTNNLSSVVALSAEQMPQISTLATTYMESLQTANSQYTTVDELLQAKESIHLSFGEQLQQVLTPEQYAQWTENRGQRTETQATLQTTSVATQSNVDCVQNPSSPISRWETEYVPIAGEQECWTIDLGVKKQIKFTYIVDLETVGAYDGITIYEIDNAGNATPRLYLFATAQSGTITTTTLSGKAKVVFNCI